MPDISKLVIEVDSKGVLKATGDLEVFSKIGQKAGKSADDLADKMGALQLIAGKLPGPLKSVAAGLMGMVSPATAAVSAFMEVGQAAVKYVQESVDAFAKYETIKTNLEVVMGSAEKADAMFNKLQLVARNTMFDTSQVAEAATTLQKFGVSTRELIPTLEMLGNLSLGNAEKFNQLTQVYAKMTSAEEASAMTMKQLASAGVPIQRLLNDIGKSGETSFEAITEAMKKATQEGGMFRGAMDKASGTIKGMKSTVETLKEQYKALAAETKGLSEAAKWWYSVEAAHYERKIKLIEDEIEYKKQLEGTGTVEDDYNFAIKQMESYKKELNDVIELRRTIITDDNDIGYEKIGNNYFTEENAVIVKQMDEAVKHWEKIAQNMKPALEHQRKINEAQEEYNKLLSDTKTAYDGMMEQVNSVYEKTTRGHTEKMQDEIDKLIKFRNEGKKTEERLIREDGAWITKEVVTALSSQDKLKIDEVINYYNEQMQKAGSKADVVKHKFEDWVKVLAQATGYLEEDIGGKWDDNLEKFAGGWGGLETVKKYAAEVQSIQDILLSQDGDLIKVLGLDHLDVLESSADKVRSVLEAMLNSGKWDGTEQSVQYLVKALEKLDKTVSDSHFTKFLDELKKEIELLGKSPEEIAIHNTKELLKSNGVQNPTDKQAEQVLDASFERDMKKIENQIKFNEQLEKEAHIRELIEKYGSREKAEAYFGKEVEEKFTKTKQSLEEELDLQKKLLFFGEERFRIEQLIAEGYDEAQAKKIYALEQERDATEALINALNQLKEAGLQITASGLIDFAHDLGSAFRDGTISSDELSGALGNMLRAMIDAMPQLLLNVGLQLIMAKQWGLGLAFIGASGLMSFVSGLIDDSQDNGRNDEAERLRRIQDQISDLIEQQRKQAEYYAVKKRNVNASAVSVNDAIITPKGMVYTHPEDYIIATKRPESLMSGGGAGNVFVNIVNNAPVEIKEEREIADDGTKVIKLTIEKVVQSGIANGTFDGAFNAMNNRRSGRRTQNW